MGDPMPGSAEYDAEKDSEEKGKDNHSKSALKRMQGREGDAGTEIVVLSDAVTNAIMRRIVETGGCSRKEETLDAVVREGESLIRKLREYGIITVGDTAALTEKGKKVLAFIDGLVIT